MKDALVAMALATVIASPAFAQTTGGPSPEYRHAVPGAPPTRNSDGVAQGGRVIGHDPDAWIRNEILRHSDSGWPD
jgi:hypothetical protein